MKDVPSFHTQTSGFRVCTAFLPDIDVSWCDRSSFLGVESARDERDEITGDGVENLEGIAGGADADVCEGWALHSRRAGAEDGSRPVLKERRLGRGDRHGLRLHVGRRSRVRFGISMRLRI